MEALCASLRKWEKKARTKVVSPCTDYGRMGARQALANHPSRASVSLLRTGGQGSEMEALITANAKSASNLSSLLILAIESNYSPTSNPYCCSGG